MMYLLNPRVWIAAALVAILAFTHFTTYRVGKAVVQNKWDKSVADQRELVIKMQEQVRQTEQALIAAKNESEKRYVEQKRKAKTDAAGTELQLRRLRDELAARDRAAAKAAATGTGADGRPASERDLFGRCAEALVGMAREADELKATVIGLQGYVNNVCQAKQD